MAKLYPLFVASASFFLSYYVRLSWTILSVYMPFRPTVAQEGLAFALFFVGYVIVQIPSGFISDRFSGGIVISLSLIGLAASAVMSAMSPNVFWEYISSLIMGLTAGWVYPATINVMNHYYRDKRSVYVGYYSIAWPLAIVLSGLVLPDIAIRVGWQWGYYSSAIASIIVAILAFRLKTENTGYHMDLSLIRNRNVLLLSFGGLLFFISYWSLTLYAYKYFLYIGINSVVAGFVFSSMAISGLFSTSFSGYVISRIGTKNAVLVSLVAYGFIILAFSFIRNAALLIAISLVMGFFRFIITPGNSGLSIEIGENRAGSVSGIANMFWQSSGIIGPIVSSSLIIDLGFRNLWIALALIVFLSTFVYHGIGTSFHAAAHHGDVPQK
ncbi:MFS transporter [Thermoplasma sp.]|uniref:MFS transporter n=1 Tax=Thermoplasma sp. TaxID=1973142 RepID=UPI001282E12E|nr:MFS transporter [Thermoplasma sp.]KAA8922721.1 MAG: MFS transporter [Thermoplasma sp.]